MHIHRLYLLVLHQLTLILVWIGLYHLLVLGYQWLAHDCLLHASLFKHHEFVVFFLCHFKGQLRKCIRFGLGRQQPLLCYLLSLFGDAKLPVCVQLTTVVETATLTLLLRAKYRKTSEQPVLVFDETVRSDKQRQLALSLLRHVALVEDVTLRVISA